MFILINRFACRQLGLKPKRTLRLVLWTDEEAGGVGSLQYYHAHQDEADNYSILMESDEGVFTPYGLRFHGSDNAKTVCIQLLWNLSLYQDTSEMRTPHYPGHFNLPQWCPD